MDINKIDAFNREALQFIGMEKAPESLAKSIMDRIQVESQQVRTAYVPLISRKGWIALGCFVLVLVMLLWFSTSSGHGSNSIIPDLALSGFYNSYIEPLIITLAGNHSLTLFLLCGAAATLLLFADRFFSEHLFKQQ
jgi:hypothetical protein